MSALATMTRRPALRRLGVGLAAGGLLVWSAVANAATPPESFSPLVKQVSPAVVNIASTRQAERRELPDLPFSMPKGSPFEKFFKQFGDKEHAPARKMTALGSGFVIDPSGYVVTNNHVVNGASDVSVRLSDETTYPATVVGVDPQTDLALLKVEADAPLPSVKLGDSDAAEVGDWVVAVGNPFGLGGTVTAGILSARGRNINAGPYDDFLQIDASINQGNSGGPLFNLDGEVVGVNTAIFSPNGGSVGIGFAIPSNMVKMVVAQLRDNGKVERGWLGVRIQGVTPDIATALGLDEDNGAMVTEVTPDSPADRAGLRQGDVIRVFNGEDIADGRELARVVGQTAANSDAKVKIWRDGADKTLSVQIGEQPASLAMAGQAPQDDAETATSDALGAELATLTPERRQQLGLDESVDGVLVLDVKEVSPRGLRPGDVIKKIGDTEVSTPRAVDGAVSEAREKGRESVLLVVNRQGHDLFVGLKLPVA